MKKLSALLHAVALSGLLASAGSFAAACSAPAGAQLIVPGQLNMSTNPTLPPLQFVDNTGQLKGMRIELGSEIAKRLCLEPNYIRIEFSAMVPGLQGGRWDMINTGIFFTPERAKIMWMIPYENQSVGLSTMPDNPAGIGKAEDLAGKRVGVEIGGFEEKAIRRVSAELQAKKLKPIEILTFDNFAIAFQALRAGQVDAVISLDAVANEYQRQGQFRQVISGLEPTPVSLAFRDRALAEATAKVLNEMRADGSLEALFKRFNAQTTSGTFTVHGPSL
ncbi:ABC transporter substrate-binding protein [Affinibrenneria salicis]|uniref:ABC transporter substrate-binding protein n=1 Tax=Affinibrenneria salicis TaxID=2590031 RepID=A0A5J5FYL1_9GAMM|nr:ABC transporter substrate-binding protein [Affinibrenneria salicis]KAA8998977.1 ABC transporter substrate-binding protein [Affinibrenneria salicis]